VALEGRARASGRALPSGELLCLTIHAGPLAWLHPLTPCAKRNPNLQAECLLVLSDMVIRRSAVLQTKHKYKEGDEKYEGKCCCNRNDIARGPKDVVDLGCRSIVVFDPARAGAAMSAAEGRRKTGGEARIRSRTGPSTVASMRLLRLFRLRIVVRLLRRLHRELVPHHAEHQQADGEHDVRDPDKVELVLEEAQDDDGVGELAEGGAGIGAVKGALGGAEVENVVLGVDDASVGGHRDDGGRPPTAPAACLICLPCWLMLVIQIVLVHFTAGADACRALMSRAHVLTFHSPAG